MQKCTRVTYSQNKRAFIYSSFFVEVICFASWLSQGQVLNPVPCERRNFVRVWEALSPQRDAGVLMSGGVREVRQSATYHDGLGRPVQTVVKGGSLAGSSAAARDLVTLITYDGRGREAEKYLPYADGSSDGLFKEN